MKPLVAKIKPENGFSQLLHIGLLLVLPVAIFVLAKKNFVPLAFALILLSKWRMFAVRPRFWLANIRANAIDILVGLSFLAFIVHSGSLWLQIVWAVLYAAWLVVIKRGSNAIMTSVQSAIGLFVGLSALFISWSGGPDYGLALVAGIICYLAARHFFDNFDEPYAKLLAYICGYFGAALVWVLSHWLLFYGSIAQPTILLVAIGYGVGALYYLDHFDKLTALVQRQFIFIMLAIVVVVLSLSNWGSKVV